MWCFRLIWQYSENWQVLCSCGAIPNHNTLHYSLCHNYGNRDFSSQNQINLLFHAGEPLINSETLLCCDVHMSTQSFWICVADTFEYWCAYVVYTCTRACALQWRDICTSSQCFIPGCSHCYLWVFMCKV